MLQEPIAQLVADAEFDLQNHLYKKFGHVSPSIHGYHVKDGKIASVTAAEFEGEFRDVAPGLVKRLLKKFPAVVTSAEVWISDDGEQIGNARPERAMITVHGTDRVWVMLCGIERQSPKQLVKGDLVAQAAIGRMTADMGRAAARDLDRLLREGGPTWENDAAMILARMVENLGDIKPATDVLYAPDVPGDRLAKATAMVEKLTCERWRRHPTADSPDTVVHLLGVTVLLQLDRLGSFGDVERILMALSVEFQKELRQAGSPSAVDPKGELAIEGHLLPVSLAHGLTEMAVRWVDGVGATRVAASDNTRRVLNDRLAGGVQRFASNPLNRELVLTIPVAATLSAPANLMPFQALAAAAPNIDGSIAALIDRVSGLVDAAVGRVAASFEVTMRFVMFGPIYECLRAMNQRSILSAASDVVRLANDLAKQRAGGGDTEPLKAIVAAAEFAKPIPHELVMATVWGSHSVCIPLHLQRSPYWNLSQYTEMVAQALRDAGALVEVGRATHKLPEHLKDPFGAMMYPDATGAWFSPSAMSMPKALGVLQTLTWDFLRSAEAVDPITLALPVPHMLQRMGAVSVVQRHFVPDAYRVFKEAFSSAECGVEQCWERAASRHSGLRDLALTNPTVVKPPEIVALSLQLHWARAPTLRVRPTLTERMRFMDISAKLPSRIIAAPFPLQYVHFGAADPIAQVDLAGDGEGEGAAMPFVGAFVRHSKTSDGRILDVRMIWQNNQDPRHILTSAVTLQALDSEQTVFDCIQQALQASSTDDAAAAPEAAALEELVKVLFYVSSRGARLIESDERAAALKNIGKKSPEQQAQILERSRGLYDHILVGPEKPLGFEEPGEGAVRRQTKVSVRRGHYHGYWHGPGRTEYVLHLLDPIIVNRHLLQDGDDPPTPRDYTLH